LTLFAPLVFFPTYFRRRLEIRRLPPQGQFVFSFPPLYAPFVESDDVSACQEVSSVRPPPCGLAPLCLPSSNFSFLLAWHGFRVPRVSDETGPPGQFFLTFGSFLARLGGSGNGVPVANG